ncbi:mCG144552, partial [Mus musculus]
KKRWGGTEWSTGRIFSGSDTGRRSRARVIHGGDQTGHLNTKCILLSSDSPRQHAVFLNPLGLSEEKKTPSRAS